MALSYIAVLVARGGAMMLYYPLLKRLGTGCTWKDAIVMWWGGLRGSVGLALGLSIHHTLYDRKMWGDGAAMHWGVPLDLRTLDCRDQPMMVLYLSVVVVVSTVVINGVTMAPLMKALRLTDVPQDRRFMLQMAKKRLGEPTAERREADV